MEDLFSISYRVTEDPQLHHFHSHEDFEIFMFHQGVCRYFINNQIYDLQPGDILFMDGLALHKPNIPANSEYIRSHIHFPPEIMKPILKSMKAENLLNVFQRSTHHLIRTNNTKMLQNVEEIIQRMNKVHLCTDLKELEKIWEITFLLGQLLVLIHRLLKDSSAPIKNNESVKIEHAEKIASYIQEHFHSAITISDLSAHLNFNKSHISHIFKEMTGYTIMEYVMASRLKQAKYLLEADETKSIQQIAYDSGFENTSHFSRYFKEKIGVTPKAYRKKRLAIYHV